MKSLLTVGKPRGTVVDIQKSNVDCRGPREPTHLSSHVLSLNHHLIVFPILSDHVRKGRPYDA